MRPPVEVWRAIAAIAGRDWRWARRQTATGQNLFPPRIVAGVVLAEIPVPRPHGAALPPVPPVDRPAPAPQPSTSSPALVLDVMTLGKVAISAWLNHRGLEDEVAALILQSASKGWQKKSRAFSADARTLGITETKLIDLIIAGEAPPRPTPDPAVLRKRLEAIEGCGTVAVG